MSGKTIAVLNDEALEVIAQSELAVLKRAQQDGREKKVAERNFNKVVLEEEGEEEVAEEEEDGGITAEVLDEIDDSDDDDDDDMYTFSTHLSPFWAAAAATFSPSAAVQRWQKR